MTSLALAEAATDPSVRGAPREVLLYLSTVLDVQEYRTLKLWPVAHAVGKNKATVGRAIVTLLRSGYIREGPRTEHGRRSFRILATRGEAVGKTA